MNTDFCFPNTEAELLILKKNYIATDLYSKLHLQCWLYIEIMNK